MKKQPNLNRVARRMLRQIIASLTLVLLLTCFVATDTQAQGSSDGSIYSRFGLGELRSFGSSQVEALGGGGTGLSSFTYVNPANPATLADQILVRAAIGASFQSTRLTDATDNTSILTSGNLEAVQFSLPILPRTFGVSASLEPYSRVNYRVQSGGTYVSTGPVQDTTSFLTTYEGAGGLQQFSLGAGYRFGRVLRLGASMNVVFGIEDEIRTTTFGDDISFMPTVVTNSTRMAGLSGTFGGLAVMSKLLSQRDILTLGAAFTLPTTLHARRVRTLGQGLEADTLGASTKGDLTLPFSVRAGLSYRPDERWLFLMDGTYEPWSNFKSDLVLPGYTPGAASFMNDRMRISGGLEFMPAGSRMIAGFFSRTAYRLGFFYDQSYVNPTSDYQLNTLGATAGFSFPSAFTGTRVDLNFEVGRQGTARDVLVENMYYRIAAHVSIGERWFERRRLR